MEKYTVTRMQKYLGAVSLVAVAGACSSDVVGVEQDLRPSFDSGYTIGSGNRIGTTSTFDPIAGSQSYTASTDTTTNVDRTGYTIGSGH